MNYSATHSLFSHSLMLAVLSLLLIGVGCVQIGSSSGQAPAMYLLEANFDSPPIQQKLPAGPVVAVAAGTAAPGYDTDKMAFMRNTSHLEYYTSSRWVDAPARMLTSLLAKALEQKGHFRAVVSAPTPVKSDYLINFEILRLLQEFNGPDSRMRLTLRVEVIDREGIVLASRLFDVTEAANSQDAVGGVHAANRLLEGLLPEVATFCAAEARARK